MRGVLPNPMTLFQKPGQPCLCEATAEAPGTWCYVRTWLAWSEEVPKLRSYELIVRGCTVWPEVASRTLAKTKAAALHYAYALASAIIVTI
jgi:hypothetical protein